MEHLRTGAEFDRRKAVCVVALLAVALLSIFVVMPRMSDPSTYVGTIGYLDQKRTEVLQLTATSTAASAALSVIPGDACTPIAEQLADLSSNFLLVLSAIYLEKYLLTIIGFVAWAIVAPVSCALFGYHLVFGREAARTLAWKLMALALSVSVVIPASVGVSRMIEATYGQPTEGQIVVPEVDQAQEEGEGDVLSGLLSPITDAASSAARQGEEALNQLVERLAVLIVTACLIPVLVLLFFVWLTKTILGVDFQVPHKALPGLRRGV